MRRRQKAICLGKAETYDDYKALFHSPTATELEQQFADIAGSTFESLPPSLMQAFKNVDTTDTGYNEAAQKICDSSLQDSMTLDQLILACVWKHVETFCPGGTMDDELETYVDTVTFKLPKVVYDWTASPPPPPPASFGAYHDLVAADPEGMNALREKLLEFWPSLTYVASQTYGSNIGHERSSDGRGYGPL